MRKRLRAIRASYSKPVKLYRDESGCFFDKHPLKPGAHQLTREQVQELTQSKASVIVLSATAELDDWSKIIAS